MKVSHFLTIFTFVILGSSSQVFAKEISPKVVSKVATNDVLNLEVFSGKSLSLQEAIQLALEQNLNLKSKYSDVEAAKGAIKTAGVRQNPFFEIIESRAENTYSGGLNYVFELGGKRRKRKKVAEKLFGASTKEYEAFEHDLKINTRKLYAHYLVDLERLKVKTNNEILATELVDITQKRYEAGDVPAIDIKVAEQLRLSVQSDILNLQNEVLTDRLGLNLLLAIDSLSEWTPSTKIQELIGSKSFKPLSNLKFLALNNRADLQKANFLVEAAEAQLELAKANRIPNLQENFAVVRANALATNNNSPDVFTTNIRTDTVIEIPVLNRQQGPIAEAKAKIQKTQYDKQALENSIMSDVSGAYSKINLAKQKITLAEKNVESTHEIADLMQKGYQAGRMNILQVISARQSLVTAQDEYYSAVLEYEGAVSDMENAIDAPIEEAES